MTAVTRADYTDGVMQVGRSSQLAYVSAKSRGTDNNLPQPKYDHNEDALGIYSSTDGRILRAIVADGIGGRMGGEIASEFAVTVTLSLSRIGQQVADIIPKILDRFVLAFSKAKGRNKEIVAEMGTTIAIADIQDGYLQSHHIGDSKVVMFRDGELFFETGDHVVIDRERLSNEQLAAGQAPRFRKFLRRSLSLKAGAPVQNSALLESSPKVKLQKGNVIIVASDGLWDAVSMSGVNKVVATHQSREYDVEAIRDFLMRMIRIKNGSDNISIAVIHYAED